MMKVLLYALLYAIAITIIIATTSSVGAIPATILGFLVVIIVSLFISQSELREIKSISVSQTQQPNMNSPAKNADATTLNKMLDVGGAAANKRTNNVTSIDEWIPLALRGDAQAQFNLGQLYQSGQGVTQDFHQAAVWYLKAADQGLAQAQHNLGLLYVNGQGVTKNHQQSIDWYRKAAEQGVAQAQFNLGLIYENGQFVTQDFLQAANWYHKAAQQGVAQAQFNLGVIYEKGRGVIQDYQQAINWYSKAAEQGFALAEFNLGVIYANGQGVAKDLIEAHKWFNLAGSGGYSDGIKNRELLEKILTPDQMTDAKQRASAWMIKLLKRTGVQVIEHQTPIFRFFGEVLSANLYGIKVVSRSLEGSEEAIKEIIGSKESKIQQIISTNHGTVQAHLLALQAAAFYVCANQLSSSRRDVLTEVSEGISDGFSAVLGEIKCAIYDLFIDYAHSLANELKELKDKDDDGFCIDMGATANLVVNNIGEQCSINTLFADNQLEKFIIAEIISRSGIKLLVSLLLNGEIAYSEPFAR